MRIGCDVTETGLELRVDDRRFHVHFPPAIWQAYPYRQAFADNFAYLKTLHLPQMLDRQEPLEYATALPLFRHQIFMAMLNNISFCADVDGVSTAENLKRFLALELRFHDHATNVPIGGKSLGERAVLNMSFGKDSLLTWAVARDLGLRPLLIMSVDNDGPREYAYKADLARRFCAEFGETLHVVQNNTGLIHRYEYWGTPFTEWGFGHLISEYAMYAVPFAYDFDARYILLGNEKSCDDSYVNRDGFKAYPVYDQSSEWGLELSNIARGLTASPMTVMSLIEPLHDLAITKILHTQYPEVAKYQMSCFPDENDYGKDAHWCGHCTKCARNFVFMQANGVDPRSVGHNVDMFQAECSDNFALLRGAKKGIPTVGYDATPCGRDEQLFALFLAHTRGAQGPVMDLFRSTFLREAEQRQDEFHERFFTVQPARTIPAPLLDRVIDLYTEALDGG
ncbi:MAG: hypothetical protein A3H91_04805 [Gammaproteobacteria bacterium RIFCSPLOWO2_02_FULL_61_13]|nr:MAG: hypothetical protein A3H91_04805 [Gammaproteobacteria bacterium RIFCSPLOWO2_02_FULL_61_13]